MLAIVLQAAGAVALAVGASLAWGLAAGVLVAGTALTLFGVAIERGSR